MRFRPRLPFALLVLVALALVSCKGYPYVEIQQGVSQERLIRVLGQPDFVTTLENQRTRWVYWRRPMRDAGRVLHRAAEEKILRISPTEYYPTRDRATPFAEHTHSGGEFGFTLIITFRPDETIDDFEYHIHQTHGISGPVKGSGID